MQIRFAGSLIFCVTFYLTAINEASHDSRVIMCFAGAFLSVWGFQQSFKSYIPSTNPDMMNLQVLHHPAGRNLLTATLKHSSIFIVSQ